jgi:hypothetical protein
VILECSDNTCKNGGMCHEYLNSIECECNEYYMGSFCEYQVNNFNLTQIIGNINFILDLNNLEALKDPKAVDDLINIFRLHPEFFNQELSEAIYDYISNIAFKKVNNIDLAQDNDYILDLINLGLLTNQYLKFLIRLKLNSTSNSTKNETLNIKIDNIIEKFVKDTNVTNPTIRGNKEFSVFMYKANQSDNATTLSIHNSLSIMVSAECIKRLKQEYNIKDDSDILFVGKNYNMSNSNKSIAFSYDAYRYTDRLKLNTSICDDTEVTIKIPLNAATNNETQYNITLYKEMKKNGIDIFNQSDPFFTNRCIPFVDPITGADASLTYRRENYYQTQQPICVGLVCNFTGINDFDYLECECKGFDSSDNISNVVVEFLMISIGDINIDIVKCFNLIPVLLL